MKSKPIIIFKVGSNGATCAVTADCLTTTNFDCTATKCSCTLPYVWQSTGLTCDCVLPYSLISPNCGKILQRNFYFNNGKILFFI